MFPTLGHLINYLFGTNINFPMPTYGFILVMAFATSGIVLNMAFRRKERLGELKSHKSKELVSGPINYFDLLFTAFFYFIIFYKIVGVMFDYDTFTKDINAYIFSLQGNIVAGVLAAIGGFAFSFFNAKKKFSEIPIYNEVDILPHQITINIVMIAALSGIVGAKLFDILENLESFMKDPLDQLFSTGGFTFYGGLILGTLSVGIYIRKRGISILQMLDSGAPAILAAYAVGRMACMLSGDGCWGIPNPEPQPEWLVFLPDWMWAYDFPHNVIKEGVQISGCNGEYCYMLDVPVFPTPFYESSLSALFFLIVWFVQNKIKAPGTMFFIAIGLNGIARFFIEKIRVNNEYHIGGGITQAEIISSLLVVTGIVGIVVLHRMYKRKTKVY